jgi:hypothetical protein
LQACVRRCSRGSRPLRGGPGLTLLALSTNLIDNAAFRPSRRAQVRGLQAGLQFPV